MSRVIHSYDAPGRFVAGTVGMPGERTFYLQAREAGLLTSVSLEKAQVALLADRVQEMLEEVGAIGTSTVRDDNDPLSLPIEEEFRVGAMGLAWDPERQQIVIEAHALTDDEDAPDVGDDDPVGPDTLRVRIDAGMAGAFVRRCRALVSAGRPPCPFCMQPLDPSGHICARANGYRRRA